MIRPASPLAFALVAIFAAACLCLPIAIYIRSASDYLTAQRESNWPATSRERRLRVALNDAVGPYGGPFRPIPRCFPCYSKDARWFRDRRIQPLCHLSGLGQRRQDRTGSRQKRSSARGEEPLKELGALARQQPALDLRRARA